MVISSSSDYLELKKRKTLQSTPTSNHRFYENRNNSTYIKNKQYSIISNTDNYDRYNLIETQNRFDVPIQNNCVLYTCDSSIQNSSKRLYDVQKKYEKHKNIPSYMQYINSNKCCK